MAEFRIKNGLAIGPYNVGATTATNMAYVGGPGSVNSIIFPVGVGTPNVDLSPLWLTNNTSNTVYSYFLGNVPGFLGTEGPADGKIIFVMFQDDSSSLASGNRMFTSTTLGTFQSGGIVGLIHVNSAWYEFCRSNNFQASQTTRTEIATYSIAGSASVDVTFARVVQLISTAAGTVLVSFSGGYAYQEITVVPIYAPGSTLFLNAGSPGAVGNLLVGGTGIFLASNSGIYKFMYIPSGGGGNAAKWELVKGGVSN